jgi:hypothetical protein
MARLTGPIEHQLELEPIGYQSGNATNEWDANWLLVRIRAKDARREWSATDPAFLTWELRSLVSWLHGLADGERDRARAFGGIEPCLKFEADGSGDATRLRVRFQLEFLPPTREWWNAEAKAWIDFQPGAEGLRRFADELEAELVRFPTRPGSS